jgi:hypothetical protein
MLVVFFLQENANVSSYDRQKIDLLNIKGQRLEISLSLEDITDKESSSTDLISLVNRIQSTH